MGKEPKNQPNDPPNDTPNDPPDRSHPADGAEQLSASHSDAESRFLMDPLGNTIQSDTEFPAADPLAVPPAESASSPQGNSSDIPTTLGRFKIHGVLGEGGFGTVYLGFDELLKREVAIKVPIQVLSGVELDKFLEEAQRLAQLRHPGIVTVFDVGEFDGRCYIVSDYLKGLSLAKWVGAKAYGCAVCGRLECGNFGPSHR